MSFSALPNIKHSGDCEVFNFYMGNIYKRFKRKKTEQATLTLKTDRQKKKKKKRGVFVTKLHTWRMPLLIAQAKRTRL